LDEVEFLGVWL